MSVDELIGRLYEVKSMYINGGELPIRYGGKDVDIDFKLALEPDKENGYRKVLFPIVSNLDFAGEAECQIREHLLLKSKEMDCDIAEAVSKMNIFDIIG